MYHFCCKTPPLLIPEPVVQKKTSNQVVYSIEDWDNNTRFCVLVKGEGAFDALSQDFLDIYHKACKDKGCTTPFKTAADWLIKKYPREQAIICLFDPFSNTLRAVALGGKLRVSKDGNLSFEEETSSPHTSASIEQKISLKHLNVLFNEKVIPLF